MAKLPVPFRDLTAGEDSGVVGYLRFTDEPDGKGIRGALFVVSNRGEPLDFSFTRIDVHSSFLCGEQVRKGDKLSPPCPEHCFRPLPECLT